jgi:hypothetical protein
MAGVVVKHYRVSGMTVMLHMGLETILEHDQQRSRSIVTIHSRKNWTRHLALTLARNPPFSELKKKIGPSNTFQELLCAALQGAADRC